MIEIILGFFFMALVIAAMAIGVIMGRKPIAGSCGGIGAALGEKDYVCELCGDDPNKCESINEGSGTEADTSLAYNAATRR